MKAKKIVLTGGGTGGHVYPNLAIYDGLKKRDPDTRFLYIGTRDGAEYPILNNLGRPIEIQTVPAVGFPMSMRSLKTLWALCVLLVGAVKALFILLRFRPDLVVATGGYVSAPTLLAASWLRVPIFIHEQNAVPGRLNQLMARFARRVGVSFRDTPGLPQAKTVYVGYPVRSAIAPRDGSQIREKLQIPPQNKVVFIFGGSGGARTINRAAAEILPMLMTNPKLTVIWGTGRGYGRDYSAFEESLRQVRKVGVEPDQPGRIIIREYFDKIDEIYAIADIVVSRAGAGTLKEIVQSAIPAVIIPKINLPGDHQIRNAMAVEKTGGSVTVLERVRHLPDGRREIVVDETELYSILMDLIEDPFHLGEMRRRLLNQEREDSVGLIMDELDRMLEPPPQKITDRTVDVFYLQRQNSDGMIELIFDTTSFGRSPLLDVVLTEARSPVRFDLKVSSYLGEIVLIPMKGEIEVNGNPVSSKTLIKEGDRLRFDGYEFVLKSYREKIADMPVKGQSRSRMIGSSMGIAISRMGGFLRDVVIAAFFGASRFTDLYWAGLTISNFMRRLVAETAMENIFMPIYLRLYRRVGHERTWKASSSILNFSILLSVFFVLMGIFFTPWLVSVLYPGFVDKGLLPEAVNMFRIMFPYLVLVSIAGILSTILKAHGRFGVSEAASVFFSVGSILVVLLFNQSIGLYSMGVGVLFGGFLHVLALLPFFWSIFRNRKGGIGYRPLFHFASPANKKYYSQLLPVGGDVVLSKTSEIVDQFLASMQIEGAISILSFAKQVFRLPFAIISQAANTVIMRDFSDNLAEHERDRAARLFIEGIKINIFILAPITILMIVLALPLVSVVYQRNTFQSESALFTARALQLYAIGLIGWGLHALTGRIFAARFDIRISMFINAMMLSVNIALCVILVKTPLGYLGLALATSLSYLFFALLRIIVLIRRMRREEIRLDMGDALSSLWKTMISSLLMVVLLLAIKGLFSTISFSSPWIGHLVTLVSLGFIGISIYILCSLLLKNTEILIFRKKRNRRIEQADPELLPPGAFLEHVAARPAQYAAEFAYKTGVYLSSASWNVRNIGIKLIGLFGQVEHAAYLIDILVSRSENGFIRRNAVVSLRQLKAWDDEVRRGIRAALQDPYYEVRVSAVQLLAETVDENDPMTPELLEMIGKRLPRKGVEEQCGLILLLSRIGGQEQLSWLEPFMMHSNSLLRENLLKACLKLFERGKLDREQLQTFLERVLITSNNLQPSFRLKEILMEIKKVLS